MRKKLAVALSVGALVPFTLAACGGDDEEPAADSGAATTTTEETTTSASGGGGGGGVEIAAVPDGSFAYEQDSVEAAAGEVEIDFDNPASLGHDVNVESPEGEDLGGTEVIAEDSATTTVELKAGEYTFYCSVPGHREGGMEGTLTVK